MTFDPSMGVPESELYDVEVLNGAASSGRWLFTTTVKRSSGLKRIGWSAAISMTFCESKSWR